MTIRPYEEVADAFFALLAARGRNDDLVRLFDEMQTARANKSARETGTPMEGAAPWLRGQISICDEYLTRLEMALKDAEGKANPDASDGFRKGVV